MRDPSGCCTEYGPGLTGAPGWRGDAVPSGVSVVTSMTRAPCGAPDAEGTAAAPAVASVTERPPRTASRVDRRTLVLELVEETEQQVVDDLGLLHLHEVAGAELDVRR